MSKKEDVKAEKAEEKPETWLSIHEVGMAATRKEPLEPLGPGHSYEDRVRAQAKSLGIGEQEGETLEHLMFRISMGGST